VNLFSVVPCRQRHPKSLHIRATIPDAKALKIG
jgi:hypothetical protein